MRNLCICVFATKTIFFHHAIPNIQIVRKSHNDFIKWEHVPRYRPFVRGSHRSPVISPHKGKWRGVFMFSLICVWTNNWVNNREAGALRCHRAHYDATVMHNCSDQGLVGSQNIREWVYCITLKIFGQKIGLNLLWTIWISHVIAGRLLECVAVMNKGSFNVVIEIN